MNGIDPLGMFGSAPAPVKVAAVECPAPGIYYGVAASDYHSWPAISSTLIKRYASNPSTAREPYIPGDDANVGTGIHCWSLQGQAGLDTECIFGPKFGKSEKDLAAKATLIKAHPTKTVLPAFYGSPAPGLPTMDVLTGVDTALRAHPKIGPVMDRSQKEVSLVWIDPDSQLTCKARLDILDGRILWDLKKTRKISGLKWEMDGGLNYRLQAGHYLNGAEACDLDPVAFGFIACEAFPPYEVRAFYSDPEKTETAQAEVKRLIGLIKQSVCEDYWPNFPAPPGVYDWNDLTPDDTIEII
jgi:hypothetical protein